MKTTTPFRRCCRCSRRPPGRRSRRSHNLMSASGAVAWALPPSRIAKRSHRCAPQVKGVLFQLRNECVTVSVRRSTLAFGRPPWLRKRSLARQARSMHELDMLGERFWAWRARQQPRTRDDIPRLDRPAGWRPEVDPALAGRRREELAAFQAELARIRPDQVADRVDHRLLRSAMARVQWESDILRVREIPRFWVDQALGPVFDALLRPGVDADPVSRIAEVVRLLRAVPATLAHAPQALAQPAREFAELAVAELDGIAERIAACTRALIGIDPAAAPELASAAAEAGAALQRFGEQLAARIPNLPPARPVGRQQYEWFLREVA